jgi:hypothetical protein
MDLKGAQLLLKVGTWVAKAKDSRRQEMKWKHFDF